MQQTFILHDTKIYLRPVKKKDAVSILKLAKDKEIAEFTNVPHPYTLEHAHAFIQETHRNMKKGKAVELGIFNLKNHEFLGIVGITNIHEKYGYADIAYWIGKKFWRNGYATQAIKLMISYAFSVLKLHRLQAVVRHTNIASLALLSKAGFKIEGRLRQIVYKKGVYLDRVLFGMLDFEYKNKNKKIRKSI